MSNAAARRLHLSANTRPQHSSAFQPSPGFLLFEVVAVRWIIGILAVAIVVGWVACQVNISEAITDNHVVHTVWRHTANGWEKVSALSGLKFQPSAVTDVWNSHPHPVVIASLVAMLSLMALVAFNPATKPVLKTYKLFRANDSKAAENHALNPHCGQLELRSRAWYEQANSPAIEVEIFQR